MGAVIAEGLSAPLDYLLPARILDIIIKRLSFLSASITFHDPTSNEEMIFAEASSGSSKDEGGEAQAPFGIVYKVRARGPNVSVKSLSVLGTSLGARMDASRNALFSHPYPDALPLNAIAESAAGRYGDSQAPFATLCVLDMEAYFRPLRAAFPFMNLDCLKKDMMRILASSFEAAGGLYHSEDGSVVGLVCASSPTDIELLQLQLGKTLRRFVSAAADSSVPFLRSKLFESPSAKSMKQFLLNEKAAVVS